MRLFIAINFNEELKDALLDIQDALWDCGMHGNFTKEENMHMTLAFIGEYPDPRRVKDIVEGIAFDPFEIKLSGIGSFGRLWWVGTEASEPLVKLAKNLRHRLADAKIPFDKKKFSPHITVVRNARMEGGRIEDFEMPPGSEASMMVDHISLMRSDFGKGGVRYTEL